MSTDPFDVVGARRGANQPPPDPSDPVEMAVMAFSDDDIRTLSGLADPDQRAFIGAAIADRNVLAAVDPGRVTTLYYRQMMAVDETHGREARHSDPLVQKLSALEDALGERARQALAARGGRPMSMYSDEGDIAVCAVIDSLAGLDSRKAQKALRDGLERVRRAGHREVIDTAVRESIAVDLERLGMDPDLVSEL